MKQNINNITESASQKNIRIRIMKEPSINPAFKILKILREINEEQIAVEERLNRITQVIAEQMKADGCSCFVSIDDNYLEAYPNKELFYAYAALRNTGYENNFVIMDNMLYFLAYI